MSIAVEPQRGQPRSPPLAIVFAQSDARRLQSAPPLAANSAPFSDPEEGKPHAQGPSGNHNGTRVIALVGPAGAGKTDLAEAMLFASGTIQRQGSTGHASSVGDSSAEARARGGSTELNLMHFDYLGDRFAVVDAPGSIGFAADAQRAIALADIAIVVVDPDPARAPLAAPALRMLDEQGIPHVIFVNRIDQAHGSIRELLAALQPLSVSPLIARQIPIRTSDANGEKISGFVDLALERALSLCPRQALRAGAHARRPRRARGGRADAHARTARRP